MLPAVQAALQFAQSGPDACRSSLRPPTVRRIGIAGKTGTIVRKVA